MALLIFSLFLILLTQSVHGCGPAIRVPAFNGLPWARQNPKDLTFSAGDVIICNMENTHGSHVMLAISDSRVIHAPGESNLYEKKTSTTKIVEDPYEYATQLYKACKVITEFYDAEFLRTCGGDPLPTDQIVERAKKSAYTFGNSPTHYDILKCNCEHWVSAWRYGTSLTFQAGAIVLQSKFKDYQCQAPCSNRCE